MFIGNTITQNLRFAKLKLAKKNMKNGHIFFYRYNFAKNNKINQIMFPPRVFQRWLILNKVCNLHFFKLRDKL